MGLTLYRIQVYFEADQGEDIDTLEEAIERAICPHHASAPHHCPHRWMVITSELDEKEAREVEDLLNS